MCSAAHHVTRQIVCAWMAYYRARCRPRAELKLFLTSGAARPNGFAFRQMSTDPPIILCLDVKQPQDHEQGSQAVGAKGPGLPAVQPDLLLQTPTAQQLPHAAQPQLAVEPMTTAVPATTTRPAAAPEAVPAAAHDNTLMATKPAPAVGAAGMLPPKGARLFLPHN